LILLALSAAPFQDDFATVSPWQVVAAKTSQGVLRTSPGRTGTGLRLDFRLGTGAGFVLAERPLNLVLHPDDELSFWIKGTGPANHLEIKVSDGQDGANVWWNVRRNVEWPGEWTRVAVLARELGFAWGPQPGPLGRVATLQIGLSSYRGGEGSVWFDDLTIRRRTVSPAPSANAPRVTRQPGVWTYDLGGNRSVGGLLARWDSRRRPASYRLEADFGTGAWETVTTVRGRGARDARPLGDLTAERLRLVFRPNARPTAGDIEWLPLAVAWNRNAFVAAVAAQSPRADYPAMMRGERRNWTVAGRDRDPAESLLTEDGRVELVKEGPALEPMLRVDGQWGIGDDLRFKSALVDGHLPIPEVRGTFRGLNLRVLTFGREDRPGHLVARYELQNPGTKPRRATFYVGLRPYQGNPPWQNLNTFGGVTANPNVTVSSRRFTTPHGQWSTDRDATWAGASVAADGPLPALLREGHPRRSGTVIDPERAAEGVWAYDVTLQPGRTWHLNVQGGPGAKGDRLKPSEADTALAQARTAWQARTTVPFQLPAPVRWYQQVAQSNLGYIGVNRDGGGIQPGSRAYERTWMRDGSLTSAAVLRMGHPEAARDFVAFMAPWQRADGYWPCVVDHRGAETVVENDSHGQFIFAVAEVVRITGDIAFLRRYYPQVRRTVDYLERLRQTRLTDEFRTKEGGLFWGLVPESISHEGYSERPMHSYWDMFFVVRGLDDAAYLAARMGLADDAAHAQRLADATRADFIASARKSMARKGVDYFPGCAELGDFDPTATAIGLSPLGQLDFLPADAIRQTFDRYWTFFLRRQHGGQPWRDLTPYEIRIASAYLVLNQPERAQGMLDWFRTLILPPGWNHWAEIAHADRAPGKWIGDMPHTWVGSEFIKAVRNMLVMERARDHAIILGAGITDRWLVPGDPVRVTGLPVEGGTIRYTMETLADGRVRVSIPALGRAMPPGGLVVRNPRSRPPTAILENGKPVQADDMQGVRVTQTPGEVLFRYGTP